MNRTIVLIVCTCVLFACPDVFGGWCDEIVFRDDFDAPVQGKPDPAKWVINHPGWCWWTQGRTHFPCPEEPNPPDFPRVENGVCVIEHHLYNPYDSAAENTTFLGGELHTSIEFEPNRCYRFEARVRCNPYANGLVSSFFLYGYDGAKSDEIDFEFVSNKTNDDVTYPNGDPVLTNTYNESFPKPECVAPDALDLGDWNTFRIYWCPNTHRIDWTWVTDPDNDAEVSLRTETDAFFVPDEPMAVYFNFWAPKCDEWPEACDDALQPVDDPAQDQIQRYEIDYLEVCTPEPAMGLLLGLASLALTWRPSRR